MEGAGALAAFCWTGPELCRFGRGLFFPPIPSPAPAGLAAGLPSRRETKPPPFLMVVSAVETERCSCRVVPERRCLDAESVCAGELPPPDVGGVGVCILRVKRAFGCRTGLPPCWRGPCGEDPLPRLPPPFGVAASAGGAVPESPPPPTGVPLGAVSGGGKSLPMPTIPSSKSSAYTSTPRLRTPSAIRPVLPECRRVSRPVPPPNLPPPVNPSGLLPLPPLKPPSGLIPGASAVPATFEVPRRAPSGTEVLLDAPPPKPVGLEAPLPAWTEGPLSASLDVPCVAVPAGCFLTVPDGCAPPRCPPNRKKPPAAPAAPFAPAAPAAPATAFAPPAAAPAAALVPPVAAAPMILTTFVAALRIIL